ncbi:MAG: RluA family pseudouridine synthase [Spartobacteria bacterium]|nr:RluA family pseudouridine synthase [Spartobacteria bacterium]
MNHKRSTETNPTIYTVPKHRQGVILVDFLAESLKISKRAAKTLLDDKCVFVNNRRTWMAQHRLKHGDTIEVQHHHTPRKLRIDVLYQDEHFIVVNKPSGILSNGPDSMETLLQEKTGTPEIRAMHRLDKETTGCLLFVNSEIARLAMLPLFRDHQVTKNYRAIIHGKLPAETTTIRQALEGMTAQSDISVIKQTRQASYLQISIKTGRTHQIRKHLAGIHHPIIGDKKYITRKLNTQEFRTIPRHMLHAFLLVFRSPFSEKVIRCNAPLPKDFNTVLKQLKLSGGSLERKSARPKKQARPHA